MEKEKKSFLQRLKGLSKKTKIISLVVIVAIIAVITIITMIMNNIEENRRKEIEEQNKRTVPNLVGMTFKDAEEEIEKLDLEYVILPWKVPYDDDIIISQDPPAETTVTRGSKIEIALKTIVTTEASNPNGMSFKVSKEEYEEAYLSNYSNEIKLSFADDSFKYIKADLNNTASIYTNQLYYDLPQKTFFVTNITVDNNSNNVIDVRCAIDFYNINEKLQETSMKGVKNAMLSIDNNTGEKIYNTLFEMVSNKELHKFEDGICYKVFQSKVASSEWIFFEVEAMTEDIYKQKYLSEQNKEETTDNTTTETNSNKVAEIEQMIGFLNSYYDLNFNPTDEQMQEIIKFSNTTDNFNNDTLFEYIGQKGWAVRGTGTIDNNSETTSNSNNSSNNTNQNSSDTNTSSTYEEIKATLSINIKDLINSSTDPEVKTILQSNTLQVSIFVDGSLEESKSKMYHGGINSIPNTITEEFKFNIANKDSIKSNVRIVIDNTSTMIRESTLYDKSITFDKTGTYTIK